MSFSEESSRNIRDILAGVLPGYRVRSCELLEGGATNQNVLIRFEDSDELFVLRRYCRGTEACRKEVRLLQALRGSIPIPDLIAADITGLGTGGPYLLYRFLPGVTFRQIRMCGSVHDMANAACALGHSLGLLQTCEIALSSMSELKRPYEFIENDLNRPLLQERLGTEDLLLLQELFVKWSHVLRELVDAQFLVHGDFNHRNAVLDRKNGRWEVMGILDWELACVGSPLWDAARFICYEKADSLHWEPHFLEGFNAQGIGLPEEWDSLSCVINTISAAQGLASSRVQERFIPELRGLVHSGLRGKRIRLK